MALMNIARGRIVELYNRVRTGDPALSRLVLVPLEAAGIETDAVLVDKRTLAAVLAGSTNEQTTMGRKALQGSDLAAWLPDDTADQVTLQLPTVQWVSATGNAIAKTVVCYQPDITVVDDTLVIPLVVFDTVATPDGTTLPLSGGVFYRSES